MMEQVLKVQRTATFPHHNIRPENRKHILPSIQFEIYFINQRCYPSYTAMLQYFMAKLNV
jgi:hypothetical protein